MLTYCNELGLVGGNTFAIDGLRLPSNAFKGLTSRRADLEKRVKIYQKMAEKHTAKHLQKDKLGETDKKTEKRYKERQKKLKQQLEKINKFFETMEYRESVHRKEISPNVTDNESALIMNHSNIGRDCARLTK